MSNIPLRKEEFVRYIDRLREANDLCSKIDDLMRKSRDNIENDFMNGASLQINHESIVIELLKKMMHDTSEDYGDIDYFIYELDYGRKYEPDTITDKDGNNVDFSTSEKLYEYLVENYRVMGEL